MRSLIPGAGNISTAVAATPGAQFASPAQTNATGDTAVIQVVPTTSPQDPATEDLVDRLRGETVPTLEADTRAVIEVTCTTAAFIDISKRLADRLAVFIGAVVLLSFLLLTAVFRSPLVALKAALVNLLGIAPPTVRSSVFQWGWVSMPSASTRPCPSCRSPRDDVRHPLRPLDGLRGLHPLRVREGWATGDPTGSVVGGIATSAWITAALIMISVFASFVLGDTPEIKMFGFGLAVAVALDATVIRMVVVPATMTLLGSRNWWLPGWLDRILPNLDIEGTGTLGPNPAVAGRDAAHPDRPIPTRPKEPAP